jgi:hypothetical protein
MKLTFSESQIITKDEILEMLDVPENATIKKINIESISARIEVLERQRCKRTFLTEVYR